MSVALHIITAACCEATKLDVQDLRNSRKSKGIHVFRVHVSQKK